jgi:hypothetical protein
VRFNFLFFKVYQVNCLLMVIILLKRFFFSGCSLYTVLFVLTLNYENRILQDW